MCESDYDEPQIDQSEQEDQGIYYQHGMNQCRDSRVSTAKDLLSEDEEDKAKACFS